ncbi:MAG: S8 family serine peptidase [Nitrospinae bacterium]|nr:S8 family serine peptidase [Nitrospinota bacterium]
MRSDSGIRLALFVLAIWMGACGVGPEEEGDSGGTPVTDTSFMFADDTLPEGLPILTEPDDPQAVAPTPGRTSVGTTSKFASYNRLAAAVAAGPTPVIIKVAAPFVPGAAGAADIAQANGIAVAQDHVLGAVKASGQVSGVKRFEKFPQMAMTVDGPALQALYANPAVTDIWPDELHKVSLAQAGPMIGAATAWSSGYTGLGKAVAILDTGVNKTHPFLAGKVVSEACYSTTNAGQSSSSACPGGVASSVAAGSGLNCNAGYSGCSHGTHVAGIAAGKDPGGLGYSGVAKEAKIIAVQVFSYFPAGVCGGSPCVMSWTSDQIAALTRVYNLRNTYSIAAANMSLGGGQSFTTCDGHALKPAVDALRAVGIATVISSGNNGWTTSVSSPGCISTAISVGSVCDNATSFHCTATGTGGVAAYSNIASFVSLLAPGSLISSSVPGGAYVAWDGTSMAAPMVTGAWAVMKQNSPADSVTAILGKLRSSGVSVNDTRGGGSVTGLKRINLGAAIGGGTGIDGDFTGDAKGDILWRYGTTGVNYIWRMNGAVKLSQVQTKAMAAPWVQGGVGDLNGDRKMDIVWRNPSTGANMVWLMNGATVLSVHNLPTRVAPWSIEGVGDLNGDRKADLVWRNPSTGANSLWLMNGPSVVTSPALPSMGAAAWRLGGADDINGDGKADLVWRNNNGANAVWFMRGPAVASSAYLPSLVNSGWSIAGLSDLDGDGKSDLLWRSLGGANTVWFMNGAAVTSTAALTALAGTPWTIGNN